MPRISAFVTAFESAGGSRIHMDKKTTEMLLNQPTIASVMRNAGYRVEPP